LLQENKRIKRRGASTKKENQTGMRLENEVIKNILTKSIIESRREASMDKEPV
jgi:hypothetical protein